VVIEFQLHVGKGIARPPLYGRRALATGRGSCLRSLHAALKWCGVIYLLVMAWQALRERGALALDARLDRRSGKRVIVTGFLINILNPKLSIFFLAFLPQFVAANGDDLAAPRLRRRLCRAGRKAGIRGAVNQKAGSRPAALVNMLNRVTGARAERGPTRA
jgi:hypothetical protein